MISPRKHDVPRVYMARVVRVVDGDTLIMDVDVGFYITSRVTVRLYGINAPEMKGATAEEGKAARAALGDLCLRYTFKDSDIPYLIVKSRKAEDTDKYGRWLFEIQGVNEKGSFNINEEMIKLGKAVSYLP